MNPLFQRHRAVATAFTLIELLVVIAVIAILAGLLLPALARAKVQGQITTCRNNLKQLELSWNLYADDNGQHLAANLKDSESSNQWVAGDVGMLPDATNDALLQGGLLYPYNRSLAIYKCPANLKINPSSRVVPNRSYSMNCYMNGSDVGSTHDGLVGYTVNLRTVNILFPPAARAFVFVEESPNTIDDGQFGLSPAGPDYTVNNWLNYPSARHMDGANFSFADGHNEYFKWYGPELQILENLTANFPTPPITVSGVDLNSDLRRVQAALALFPGQL